MNKIFGLKHIILLLVSSVLITLGAIFLRKKKFKTICKSLLITGIVSEIIKIFYYIITNEDTFGGVLPKTDLPFHLCSIQIILICFVCFVKNKKIKRAVISFMLPTCLLGGIAALLLPAHSALNGGWIITLQYFAYHIAIIIFALYLIISKEIKFEVKDYVSCLTVLLIVFFFSFYINSILYDGVHNINFMYVTSPPVEGLPFLNENFGWLTYIVHYALLILFCITMCYLKPIIIWLKSLKNKKESNQKDDNSQEKFTENKISQDNRQ